MRSTRASASASMSMLTERVEFEGAFGTQGNYGR